MDNWLIFQNGIHAIGNHRVVFLVVLVSLMVASWFVATLLQQLFNDRLDQASRLALGLGGGILTLILLAVPVILAGVLLKYQIPYMPVFGMLLLGLFLATLFMNLRRRPRMMLHSATIYLIILLALLLFIRMAFIAGLELPLYTDGVEHFLIARDLLHPTDTPQAFYAIERLLERYYHLGFHILVVWVSALSGETVNGSMLVLGQFMQAVIPAGLYFPVKAATRSDAAALSAVLLTGLGWTMPAFASNWSKYPALTGLAGFPLVLALSYLGCTAQNTKTKWWILILMGVSTFLVTLAHTRGIIILFIGLVSLGMAKGVAHLPHRLHRIAASLLTLLTLATGYLCLRDPDTSMVLSPYLREGMVACILVLVLLPFALYTYPAPVTLALSFGVLVLTCLWVPLPSAFTQYGYFNLLDVPFVQLILCIPLALIGGLGLAGLDSLFPKWKGLVRKSCAIGMTVILWIIVIINAFSFYSFEPSPCCNLVTSDDLAAIEWIKTNVPPDRSIFVPGHRTIYQFLDVDAAMWITPLTGRETIKREYNTDMAAPETLGEMCRRGATHVYASSMPLSFRLEALEAVPSFYKPVLVLPKAQIYEVIGCR